MYHYQKNIGDYRSATMHLTLVEHGVYNQLLDWYYLDESPLPADNRTLFRRLSARTEEEQKAVLDVLSEMFSLTESGWMHKRVEREISQYKAKSQQARDAGKLGGRPSKKGVGLSENRDGFEKEPDAKPTANREPLTANQEEISKLSLASTRPVAESQPELEQAIPGKPAIPDCPHLEILSLWAEVLPALPQHSPSLWNGARASHLRARWRETAAAKGWTTKDQGLAYFRRVFAHVGNSSFLTGRVPTRDPTRRPFVIELEWLVSPGNWAKVLEGKYSEEVAAA
jgi:uncharacterized protein YdaU (DUF1376 family)